MVMSLSLIGRFPQGTGPLDSEVNAHQARCPRSCFLRAGCLDGECVMIIVLGLIVVIAAAVIGVAGVLGNRGSGHALVHPFAVFGYHVTGSAGRLFLYGIVVGAIGLAGLSLLLAGARRAARRGSAARRGLRQSRQETAAVSRDRDDLIDQHQTTRAYTASAPGGGTSRSDSHPGPDDSRRGRPHLFGRRLAPRQAAAGPPEPLNGQGAPMFPPIPRPRRSINERQQP
jgi:hypothetical protein